MFRFKEYFKNTGTLFIAEFANAFEGSLEQALKMLDKAVNCGVDALKFQIFFSDELLVPEHPKYDLFKKLEMDKSGWKILLESASRTGKLVFVDVFGEESFRFSRRFNVDAFKIPPSDMSNVELIDIVSKSKTPMILSSSASTIDDLEQAVDICKRNGLDDYVIMHGFQGYPTKLEDTNLNVIMSLEKRFSCPVGYADHVNGGSELATIMPLLAVAKGARLIEKHFTLNREKKGTDYQSSVNPDVLKKIVQNVKRLDMIFGSSVREMSPAEHEYRSDVRKRIVAKRKIKVGEKLHEDDFYLKRAPKGIFAEDVKKIIGRAVLKRIEKNQAIDWKDLEVM